jgi:hypothetical protein
VESHSTNVAVFSESQLLVKYKTMKHNAIGTYRPDKKGNYRRDGEGRFTKSGFERFWDGVKFWTKFSAVALVVTMLIGGTARAFFPKTEYVKEEVMVDNLTPKIAELKTKVVDDIQKCESKGYKENDGIIIFDSNSEASIGTMQFQRKTVIHYYKTLYGKTITPKEAILIALDDEKAEALAHDIIFKDSKGVGNWYNCSKKIDAQGRISTIKALQ